MILYQTVSPQSVELNQSRLWADKHKVVSFGARTYCSCLDADFPSRWSGGRWRQRARWSRCASWTSRWRTLWGATASSWFLLWSSATPWREGVRCTSSPPSRWPPRTWRSSSSWKVGTHADLDPVHKFIFPLGCGFPSSKQQQHIESTAQPVKHLKI